MFIGHIEATETKPRVISAASTKITANFFLFFTGHDKPPKQPSFWQNTAENKPNFW
jgi:hypothetical protein